MNEAYYTGIGIFQSYYETTLLVQYSASVVSWIPSFEIFFTFVMVCSGVMLCALSAFNISLSLSARLIFNIEPNHRPTLRQVWSTVRHSRWLNSTRLWPYDDLPFHQLLSVASFSRSLQRTGYMCHLPAMYELHPYVVSTKKRHSIWYYLKRNKPWRSYFPNNGQSTDKVSRLCLVNAYFCIFDPRPPCHCQSDSEDTPSTITTSTPDEQENTCTTTQGNSYDTSCPRVFLSDIWRIHTN
jgi:hypothetical protein